MRIEDMPDAEERAYWLGDGCMSLKKAQEFLGDMARSTLYEKMDAGEIHWSKSGRRRVIPKRAAVAYLAGALRGGGLRPVKRERSGPLMLVRRSS